MERIGFLFDDILDYDNLVLAWLKARRGKADKTDAQAFGKNLTRNLMMLRAELASRRFRFGDYAYFTIQDPKERLICAASFPERVAHHAIMNILDPIFEKFQISGSYACRRGKGTRSALLRSFDIARQRKYFLKMDVRKYFDSIDHAVLKSALRRLFKDDCVIAVLDGIIDSYDTTPGKGLPIGNLTSQYFANHYLGLLDHYAKDRLSLRSWIRYMDDILVFSDDKKSLRIIYKQTRVFCADNLRLIGRRGPYPGACSGKSYNIEQEVQQSSNRGMDHASTINFLSNEDAPELAPGYFILKPAVIDATARGAPFLGFLVKPNGIYLSTRTKRRYAAKAGKIRHDLERGRIGEREAGDRAQAMAAHTQVARSRAFRYRVHHGRALGDEPRESRRELEQRRVANAPKDGRAVSMERTA